MARKKRVLAAITVEKRKEFAYLDPRTPPQAPQAPQQQQPVQVQAHTRQTPTTPLNPFKRRKKKDPATENAEAFGRYLEE